MAFASYQFDRFKTWQYSFFLYSLGGDNTFIVRAILIIFLGDDKLT